MLNNASQQLAILTIPVTGTWLISFNIIIGSSAVSSGQLVLINSAFSNIGLTNATNQATFGGSFISATGLTIQGSLIVNGISGNIVAHISFIGGNTLTCLYTNSYLQAVRIA